MMLFLPMPYFGDQSTDTAKKLLYMIGSKARNQLHLASERGRTYGRGRIKRNTHQQRFLTAATSLVKNWSCNLVEFGNTL